MRNKTKTSAQGIWVVERSTGDEAQRRELYMDIYHDGKRYFESTGFFLKPRTKKNEKDNRIEIENAVARRNERKKQLKNPKKYAKEHVGEMLLKDWFDEYVKDLETKSETARKNTRRGFDMALLYANEKLGKKPNELRLSDVDKDFLLGYIKYLRNDCMKYQHKKRKWDDTCDFDGNQGINKDGEHLSESTVAQYFNYLGFAFKKAYKRGLVNENPFTKLDRHEKPKDIHDKREYLEMDEVQKLIDSKCGNDHVRRAFLFSCFCGLRLSDIKNLTWGGLKTDGDSNNAIDIQKTGRRIYLTLSPDALHYLPERGEASDNDHVFRLPHISSIEEDIKVWRRRAGIKKHVTFHTARHTFATMMLTLGADIYTTSKLLGHASIKTTEIYGEIINSKKQEAVNLPSGHFTHREGGEL